MSLREMIPLAEQADYTRHKAGNGIAGLSKLQSSWHLRRAASIGSEAFGCVRQTSRPLSA
jgi:hypothetical protein